MTEWFLPSVFSWLDSSIATLSRAASDMLDSDPVWPTPLCGCVHVFFLLFYLL
jgi:hypothetical protein